MSLQRIATDIGDNHKLQILGCELGFRRAEVTRYVSTNRTDGEVTTRGTLRMLCDWQDATRGNQHRQLYDAMKRAGFEAIAENHLACNFT